MKRQLFFLLTLLIPIAVNAYDAKINGIYYNFSGSEATVTYATNYNSYSGTVSIPSSISYNKITYIVTSIGNYAFNKCSNLSSINIPNSVTSIGNGAFSDCTGMTSITIPNSVTTIESYAFSGCI